MWLFLLVVGSFTHILVVTKQKGRGLMQIKQGGRLNQALGLQNLLNSQGTNQITRRVSCFF